MEQNDSAAGRLARMEQYLQQDPNNLHLLDEAFNAAFEAGEWERARFHLAHAQELGADARLCAFRATRIDMATRRWAEARSGLLALAGATDLAAEAHAAITHDLAYVAFRQGDFADAKAVLAPLLATGDKVAPPAAQLLWVRVLHHSADLAGAVEWAREQQARGALLSEVAGVASLAALDLGYLELAGSWANAALQHGPQLEALVTHATIALARRNAAVARGALAQALELHPEDGRAWSALGFADLLEHKLQEASHDFHQALRFMPAHVGTWNGLGWTGIVRREFTAAAQAFERAIELDRNFAESHGGAAVAYAFLGQRDSAEKAIARASGLDGASLAAKYAQAVLSGEARDAEGIQRLAARLLGAKPGPTGGTLADWLPAQSDNGPQDGAP